MLMAKLRQAAPRGDRRSKQNKNMPGQANGSSHVLKVAQHTQAGITASNRFTQTHLILVIAIVRSVPASWRPAQSGATRTAGARTLTMRRSQPPAMPKVTKEKSSTARKRSDGVHQLFEHIVFMVQANNFGRRGSCSQVLSHAAMMGSSLHKSPSPICLMCSDARQAVRHTPWHRGQDVLTAYKSTQDARTAAGLAEAVSLVDERLVVAKMQRHLLAKFLTLTFLCYLVSATALCAQSSKGLRKGRLPQQPVSCAA